MIRITAREQDRPTVERNDAHLFIESNEFPKIFLGEIVDDNSDRKPVLSQELQNILKSPSLNVAILLFRARLPKGVFTRPLSAFDRGFSRCRFSRLRSYL